MIHIHENRYTYMEEVNEGILRQFDANHRIEKPLVLDVGCGSGALSRGIEGKGYTVWGIEENREAATVAAGRITKVINADLTSLPTIRAELGDDTFDFIVFSDVLEHLYDPFLVLKEYLTFLKSGGHVLISVPNAVVWSNRIKFLVGRCEYCDTGVMDRTHIRFFTFKTARCIAGAAGCTILREDFDPYLTRAFLPVIKRIYSRGTSRERTDRRRIIDSPLYALYLKYLYPIEYFFGRLWKSMFAFRIIIVGIKP